MAETEDQPKRQKPAGIGPVIKEMASMKGMSIAGLAKKAGLGTANLNNIINNQTALTATNSVLISAALGVDDSNLPSLYELQARVVVEDVINGKVTQEAIKKIREGKDEAPADVEKVDSKVKDMANSILKKV